MPRRQTRPAYSAHHSAPTEPAARRRWFKSGGRALSQAVAATPSAATGYGIEALEPRRLLTTLISTPATGPQNFSYFDGTNAIQINYNDVSFEAVAAFVDTNNNVTVGDLVPASIPEPTIGGNLYKIYVTSSSTNSYITISQIDLASGNLINRSGTSATQQNVGDVLGAPYNTAAPSNIGAVLLGTVDLTGTPVTGVSDLRSIGLLPAPESGMLLPGIEVIPVDPATDLQNDFGNFMVGGTVTGTVSFGGNLNEFYAGAVFTGSINGGTPAASESAISTTPNFTVAGDLNEFITTGPVGTDGVLQATGAIDEPLFITGFYMTVGGTLGEVHVGNTVFGASSPDFAGTIQVQNSKYVSGLLPYPAGTQFPVIGLRGPTFAIEQPSEFNIVAETEVETLPQPGTNPDNLLAGAEIDLPNDGALTIDDPDSTSSHTDPNPQILGTEPELNVMTNEPILDKDGNIIYAASVDGVMQAAGEGDTADDYGVAMMAGQTFQTEISAGALGLNVYDPDGRLIATNDKSGAFPFQITADRPGLYVFEVTPGGAAGADTPYNLTVLNTGSLAIGGVYVLGVYSDNGLDSGILASFGDIGAIDVPGILGTAVEGIYLSSTTGPTPSDNPAVPVDAPSSISVPAGNLRVLVAEQIGQRTTADPLILADGPYLNVPFGNVGLIETVTALATSDALSVGVLDVHSQFDPNYLLATPNTFKTNDTEATAIGGYIQVIHAASTYEGELATNQGIGTVHGADMDTDAASYFDVNADNVGQDGIIDLIDVPGSFGTLAAGGPEFVTNDGGDIRYLNINIFGDVFRDSAFGGTAEEPVEYAPGQTVQVTDQTGAVLTIAPVGQNLQTSTAVTTLSSNNSSSTVTTDGVTGPQIEIETYQIRDKGGEVPVAIGSTGSLQISASGTSGTDTAVSISEIYLFNPTFGFPDVPTGQTDAYGNPTIMQPTATTTSVDTSTTTTTATATTTTTITGTISNALTLLLTGKAAINVLAVNSLGDLSTLANNTGGDIASANLPEVGQLTVHGNLGFTKPLATPAAILPTGYTFNAAADDDELSTTGFIDGGNTYPFLQQHTGIVDRGDAVAIQVYGAAGNIDVAGTLGSLITDYAISTGVKGAYAIPGQIDGVVGPVVAGILLYTDVGQGLLPTGTGLVGEGGLFATVKIGAVNNGGVNGGNIWGNILSADNAPGNNVGIDSISLINGSIIGSLIATIAGGNFFTSATANDAFDPTDNGHDIFNNPFVYDISGITVSGDGGIIGADIEATDLGPITVNGGGFGILETNIQSLDLGTIGKITASGYGIRDSNIHGAGFVGEITATGYGQEISVLTYPVSVRPSDSSTPDFDPVTGLAPNVDIDLNSVLGTTIQSPIISDVTDAGVLEDDIIDGQENFAGFSAYRVRTALPILANENALPEPTIPDVPVIGQVFGMSVTFGGTVGNIRIANTTDGLQITAGHLLGFSPHGNLSRVGISVAGTINALSIHGNFGTLYQDPRTLLYEPDSYIDAGGPNGTINQLIIYGSLFGNVTATGQINKMIVAGDVSGNVTALAHTSKLAVGTLHISGGLRDGALSINGSAGSIIINGGLGSTTGTLTINGNVNLLSVGADHKRKGSALQLALDVTGNLGNLTVYGAVTGAVTVGGNVNSFNVTNDGTRSDILTGNVLIGGRLNSAKITGGSVASDVTVNGSINSFTITRGSLDAGAVVQSQIDSVKSFRITGGSVYGLYGSVLAPSGNNQSVDVSGNFGNASVAAVYNASSGTTFHIRGSVEPGATANFTYYLNKLQVDGNVLAGSSITANPIKNQKVSGTVTGTITGA